MAFKRCARSCWSFWRSNGLDWTRFKGVKVSLKFWPKNGTGWGPVPPGARAWKMEPDGVQCPGDPIGASNIVFMGVIVAPHLIQGDVRDQTNLVFYPVLRSSFPAPGPGASPLIRKKSRWGYKCIKLIFWVFFLCLEAPILCTQPPPGFFFSLPYFHQPRTWPLRFFLCFFCVCAFF